jgi:hypothetical protein
MFKKEMKVVSEGETIIPVETPKKMAKRRLPEKVEATIKRMQDNRVADGILLRKTIEEKLAWAKAEKEKGILVVEKQLQQIKENQQTLMKLNTVIELLTDILVEKSTEEVKEE